MMWGSFTVNKSKGSDYWTLLVFTKLCIYMSRITIWNRTKKVRISSHSGILMFIIRMITVWDKPGSWSWVCPSLILTTTTLRQQILPFRSVIFGILNRKMSLPFRRSLNHWTRFSCSRRGAVWRILQLTIDAWNEENILSNGLNDGQ